MKFTVRTDYDYNDFFNWNRFYRGVIMKRFTSATRELLYVCAVAFFGCGLVLLVSRTLSAAYFVLLAVYILFIYYFCSANRLYTDWGMRYFKKHAYAERISIDENGIDCIAYGQESHFAYYDFAAAYLLPDCMYLQPKRGFVIILPARLFENDDFEDCVQLIGDSAGIPLTRVTI